MSKYLDVGKSTPSAAVRQPRPFRASERGDGKVGCAFWLLAAVVVFMIGWKAVPVRMNASQLTDFMVEQAKFSERAAPAQVQARILKKARELRMPIRKQDIEVRKPGQRIYMRVRYEVPLVFPFYTYVWDFDLIVERPIFII
jgi:hypothetical protein